MILGYLLSPAAQFGAAARDLPKAEEAAALVRLQSHNEKVRERYAQNAGLTRLRQVVAWKLDLASLDSIRQFAQRFKASGLPLHVLMNNAGVMFGPYTKTQDGFEMQIGVNHLGHFLLTHLLLDRLEETSGRIVGADSAGVCLSQRESGCLLGLCASAVVGGQRVRRCRLRRSAIAEVLLALCRLHAIQACKHHVHVRALSACVTG